MRVLCLLEAKKVENSQEGVIAGVIRKFPIIEKLKSHSIWQLESHRCPCMTCWWSWICRPLAPLLPFPSLCVPHVWTCRLHFPGSNVSWSPAGLSIANGWHGWEIKRWREQRSQVFLLLLSAVDSVSVSTWAESPPWLQLPLDKPTNPRVMPPRVICRPGSESTIFTLSLRSKCGSGFQLWPPLGYHTILCLVSQLLYHPPNQFSCFIFSL